jgi:hypothetical protein
MIPTHAGVPSSGGGTAPSSRLAAAHAGPASGRGIGGREGTWRHARAQALHSEEDRMRLVAALLVLATLLLWMLLLQA